MAPTHHTLYEYNLETQKIEFTRIGYSYLAVSNRLTIPLKSPSSSDILLTVRCRSNVSDFQRLYIADIISDRMSLNGMLASSRKAR